MENIKIQIQGNAIKFITREGVYFKNLSKFLEEIQAGKRMFAAPKSNDAKQEKQAFDAMIEAVNEIKA